MISCPKCGKENQDHYKFCLGCGNELPREGGAARPFHPTPPAGVSAASGAAAAPAARASGPGGGASPFGGPPAGGPNPFGGPPAPSPFGGPPAHAGGPAPSPFGGPPPGGPAPFGGPPPSAGPGPSPFGGPPPGGPAPSPFGGPPPVAAGGSVAPPAAGPKPAAVCPACGSPNPRGNRFCITCGSDTTVGGGASAGGAPPPAPAMNAAAPSPFGAPPSAPAPAPSPFGGPPPVANVPPAPPAPSPFGAPPGAPAAAPPPSAVSAPLAGGVPSRASLVLIRPDGTEGGSFQLSEGVTMIGRETGALFASDNYLSPRHATFTVNGSTVSVRDENALNGVYVRVERQAPTEIRDGDVFRIGQEILRYEAFRPVQTEGDGTEKQGSQIDGLVGRISLVVGREVTGNAFPVPVTGLFLGRERGDILFPEDGYVSGLHCQLSVEGGKLMLTDVGSSNGTYVRIRGERTVRNNDLLLMGQQLFRLTM